MTITKFEKSELSIRLAEKMDKMDRAWEWFTKSFIRIFIGKVKDLPGWVENETVRFWLRIACRFLYYLVILISAYLLCRDDLTHDWVLEHFNTNMKIPEMKTQFQRYISLFLIMITGWA